MPEVLFSHRTHRKTTLCRMSWDNTPLCISGYNEFPVERESRVFLVVGSEPAFDLSERCGFADSSEDMLDPAALTVCVEA